MQRADEPTGERARGRRAPRPRSAIPPGLRLALLVGPLVVLVLLVVALVAAFVLFHEAHTIRVPAP